jgi:hypothetical protein
MEEYGMTRLRRLVRERSSDYVMSVEELSRVPWLEMLDVIEAGLADRADLEQAMFMQELRPKHPEWSASDLRQWSEGGRWRHAALLGPTFPYCERCKSHFDHGTVRGGHVCSICEGSSP